MENLDPLRQKPDLDNKYQEWINARFYHATRGDEEWPDDEETFIAGAEHVWTSHVEPLMKLLKAQEEYIQFLSDKHSDAAPFLHVHNWHHSKEDIDKGIELRGKIELYKESLLNQKP